MKICVFGGSGYVGASIYKRLQNEWGNSVVGTYRREPAFLDMVQLDLNEPEKFSQFFKEEQPDIVIWAAMAGPKEYKLSDQGLIHLMTHLTPCTKLIYLSSDFVFSTGKGPYEEIDRLCLMPEGKIYSNYANAKVKAEKLIQQELTNYIILRTGPVFGLNAVGERDQHTKFLLDNLKANNPVQYRDDLIRTFIHIDDLSEVTSELARTNITGVYHVGREEPQSFYQFMKEQAEANDFNPELVELDTKRATMKNQPENLALITNQIKRVSRVVYR